MSEYKQTVTWASMRQQFGEEMSAPALKAFMRNFLSSLQSVRDVYPQATVSVVQGGIRLHPSEQPAA